MKKIYIVLTHTGTTLSRLIKMYTKDEFSHVSIALDYNLDEMYSFGRLNPYNPFMGGFVHEYIKKGTFKRFKNTSTKIYSFLINDEQYDRAKKIIEYFAKNKYKYKFNFLGLCCVSLNKKITKKNRFYCAEFVRHIMKNSSIQEVYELPDIIKPEDFKNMKNINLVYEGLLKEYNVNRSFETRVLQQV